MCNFSFYSERSQDSKRLDDLPKITYLITGTARNRFHISWFPGNAIPIKWNWCLVISGELKFKPIVYELFQLSTPPTIYYYISVSLTLCFKRIIFLKKRLLKYSWFTMFLQFLLYSKVTQSYTFFFFLIVSSDHVLTQENGHSSLCCIVGPHCLSIPNVIVCIYQPQTLLHPTPSPQLQVCSSCPWSISVLKIGSFAVF